MVVIDQNNYRDYVDIPDYIIKKLDKKQMSLTHFSDILRMALLYEYGGVWMDATLFTVEEIPDIILNNVDIESRKDVSVVRILGFLLLVSLFY